MRTSQSSQSVQHQPADKAGRKAFEFCSAFILPRFCHAETDTEGIWVCGWPGVGGVYRVLLSKCRPYPSPPPHCGSIADNLIRKLIKFQFYLFHFKLCSGAVGTFCTPARYCWCWLVGCDGFAACVCPRAVSESLYHLSLLCCVVCVFFCTLSEERKCRKEENELGGADSI